MTKSIIVVKMPFKNIISVRVKLGIQSFVFLTFSSLISDVLVVHNLASDWPCTFLQPGFFCLGLQK